MDEQVSTNERNTHFSGFARAVVEEMYKLEFWIDPGPAYDDMRQAFAEIIARRAYDLAVHCVSHANNVNPDYAQKLVDDVPDLAALPEEGQ